MDNGFTTLLLGALHGTPTRMAIYDFLFPPETIPGLSLQTTRVNPSFPPRQTRQHIESNRRTTATYAKIGRFWYQRVLNRDQMCARSQDYANFRGSRAEMAAHLGKHQISSADVNLADFKLSQISSPKSQNLCKLHPATYLLLQNNVTAEIAAQTLTASLLSQAVLTCTWANFQSSSSTVGGLPALASNRARASCKKVRLSSTGSKAASTSSRLPYP